MSRRAVFLDKDGTLIEDVPYNVDPDLIRLGPGAAEGLPRLHRAGFRLFVVTNQSGVARGRFAESALRAVHDRLKRLLGDLGVPLAGFYYCPHHPDGVVPELAVSCACRKPRPGLLFWAARQHGINLNHSWLVGDILDDIEAGARAGCRTVLLDNGHETLWQLSALRFPSVVARNLAEASEAIVSECRSGRAPQTVNSGEDL